MSETTGLGRIGEGWMGKGREEGRRAERNEEERSALLDLESNAR